MPATVAYRQVAFSSVAKLKFVITVASTPVGCPLERTGGFVSQGVATEKAMEKSLGFQLPRESLQRTKKLYIAPLVSEITSVEWEVPPFVAKT